MKKFVDGSDRFTKSLRMKYVCYYNAYFEVKPIRSFCSLDLFKSSLTEAPPEFCHYDGSQMDYMREDRFQSVPGLMYEGRQVYRRTHYIPAGEGPNNRDFYVVFS
jgi:hypothetical protein